MRILQSAFVATFAFAHMSLAATYTNPTRGLSFDYDESQWEVISTDAKKLPGESDVDKEMRQKTLVTLQRKTATEKYKSRFSVVLDSLEGALKGKKNLTFETYQKYAVDFLKSQRFSVLKEGKKGLPRFPESYEVVANQRDFGLTFHQVMLLQSSNVYLVTLAARTSEFASYSVEMDKMLASLRVGTTVSLRQSR